VFKVNLSNISAISWQYSFKELHINDLVHNQSLQFIMSFPLAWALWWWKS